MNFNSIQFLIYLPVVTALYFLLPQRWRWVMLLGASYYFYMSWNPKLVFLIAFTTVVSYVAGLVMERVREDKRKRRITLTVTLCACLGVLFFFKYSAVAAIVTFMRPIMPMRFGRAIRPLVVSDICHISSRLSAPPYAPTKTMSVYITR